MMVSFRLFAFLFGDEGVIGPINHKGIGANDNNWYVVMLD